MSHVTLNISSFHAGTQATALENFFLAEDAEEWEPNPSIQGPRMFRMMALSFCASASLGIALHSVGASAGVGLLTAWCVGNLLVLSIALLARAGRHRGSLEMSAAAVLTKPAQSASMPSLFDPRFARDPRRARRPARRSTRHVRLASATAA